MNLQSVHIYVHVYRQTLMTRPISLKGPEWFCQRATWGPADSPDELKPAAVRRHSGVFRWPHDHLKQKHSHSWSLCCCFCCLMSAASSWTNQLPQRYLHQQKQALIGSPADFYKYGTYTCTGSDQIDLICVCIFSWWWTNKTVCSGSVALAPSSGSRGNSGLSILSADRWIVGNVVLWWAACFSWEEKTWRIIVWIHELIRPEINNWSHLEFDSSSLYSTCSSVWFHMNFVPERWRHLITHSVSCPIRSSPEDRPVLWLADWWMLFGLRCPLTLTLMFFLIFCI